MTTKYLQKAKSIGSNAASATNSIVKKVKREIGNSTTNTTSTNEELLTSTTKTEESDPFHAERDENMVHHDLHSCSGSEHEIHFNPLHQPSGFTIGAGAGGGGSGGGGGHVHFQDEDTSLEYSSESKKSNYNLKSFGSGLATLSKSVAEKAAEGTKTMVAATKGASIVIAEKAAEGTKTVVSKTKTAGHTVAGATKSASMIVSEKIRKTAGTEEKGITNSEEEVTNPAMFGIPIELTISDESGNLVAELPAVISEGIQIIMEREWFLEEGIFRLSTNLHHMNAMKRSYNLREKIDFSEILDPHLPACTMKLFLRELPESLFTNQLLPQWNSFSDIDESERIDKTKLLLARLPPVNRKTLIEMFSLLNVVAQNHTINKMTIKNLGIIFVPAFGISSPDLFEYMMEEYSNIFPNHKTIAGHYPLLSPRTYASRIASSSSFPLPPGDAPLPPGDAPLPPGDAPLPPTDIPLSPAWDAPLPPGDAPLPPTAPLSTFGEVHSVKFSGASAGASVGAGTAAEAAGAVTVAHAVPPSRPPPTRSMSSGGNRATVNVTAGAVATTSKTTWNMKKPQTAWGNITPSVISSPPSSSLSTSPSASFSEEPSSGTTNTSISTHSKPAASSGYHPTSPRVPQSWINKPHSNTSNPTITNSPTAAPTTTSNTNSTSEPSGTPIKSAPPTWPPRPGKNKSTPTGSGVGSPPPTVATSTPQTDTTTSDYPVPLNLSTKPEVNPIPVASLSQRNNSNPNPPTINSGRGLPSVPKKQPQPQQQQAGGGVSTYTGSSTHTDV